MKRETAKPSVIIVLGFEQLFHNFHRALHDRADNCTGSGFTLCQEWHG